MNYTNTAVVLSLFDTGVAVARCLGRLGIAVEGYDHNPDMPGFRSKYCRARTCPNPSLDPDGLLTMLLAAADHLRPKILYPCSDDYVFFVSRYRDVLQPHFRFLLPEHSTIEIVIDKHRQIKYMKDIGVTVPATHYADSMVSLEQIIDSISFPVFLKPVLGHIWRRVFNFKGFESHNKDDLLSLCRNIFSHNLEFIIQEIIPGDCSNNFETSLYVGTDGNAVGEFTIQKLRQYPKDLGFGTLTVSTTNDEVQKLSRKVIKDLNWRGFANLEFKYDKRDQTYKFIEINARVWQQIEHAAMLGLNFPLFQYLDLIGIKHTAVDTYEKNIKWMDLKHDILTSFQMFTRGELSLKEWRNSLRRTRVFGLFALDDIRPFFYSIHYGLSIIKVPKFLFRHLLKMK